MKAVLLLRERLWLSDSDMVELVIWKSPQSLPGSRHMFKYRLAFVSSNVCIMRYDNESGKGDHKHIDEHETSYDFVDLETLQADFWADVELRRPKK